MEKFLIIEVTHLNSKIPYLRKKYTTMKDQMLEKAHELAQDLWFKCYVDKEIDESEYKELIADVNTFIVLHQHIELMIKNNSSIRK